jgi:CDP-glucose 4,6-dehydratase
MEMTPDFWFRKRVLVTGHTGFKGSWLCLWLQSLGAQVTGYSLPPPTEPSLYELAHIQRGMNAIAGDVLDLAHLRRVMREGQPEIIFHLAAQSLVRRSYLDPVATYATNVMGTVHVLESIRPVASVRAVLVVTSDKCYENREDLRAYCETDRLGGTDPYSNSKACAELVTAAFRKSFFMTPGGAKTGIASARAGNVIGGGDWAADRLIPDVMRATFAGEEISIRNLQSVRPWQHVLDPLSGYLALAEKLYHDPEHFSESWNFGPDDSETSSVLNVLGLLKELWGPGISWRLDDRVHPHEARLLNLDSGKAKTRLGWEPRWNLNSALKATVQWYKAYQSKQDLRAFTEEQIHFHQSGTVGRSEIILR